MHVPAAAAAADHARMQLRWCYSDRACWEFSQKFHVIIENDSQIRFNLRSLSVPIYISIAGERAADARR